MDKLLNFQINFRVALFISMAIGAIIFSCLFDLEILNPEHTTWLTQGDRMIHYVGSYAFRLDDWHFPITKTTMLAYPEGACIIYTDSNPLLSVIFKLLRPIFPPENQFFGLWFMLCWILQSVFGFLIINRLTKNKVYALVAAILFCLMPAMFHRIMHTNLIAFWVILWAIYVFMMNDKKQTLKEGLFFLIFTIAALIHGYLCIMTLFIGGAWLLKRGVYYLGRKQFKSLGFFVGRVVIFGFFFLTILWIFGFFYNAPNGDGDMGYGNYSLNLLSPFDPRSDVFSNILSPLVYHKFQAVEGFQYLGLGILVLFTFISLLVIKEMKFGKKLLVVFVLPILLGSGVFIYFKEVLFYQAVLFGCSILFVELMVLAFRKKEHNFFLWLLIPAIVCAVLALSHKVFLGDIRILRYSIPESGIGFELFQKIRASGRLFWVTSLVFLVMVISYLFASFKNKSVALIILILCVVMQSYEVMGIRKYITKMNGDTHTPHQVKLDEPFSSMILKSKRVDFLNTGDKGISLFAVKNKVPVNSFFLAHGNGIVTKEKLARMKQGFSDGTMLLNDTTIYFVKMVNDWNFPSQQELMFYQYSDKLMAITTSKFIGLDSNTPIIGKIKSSLSEVISYVASNKFLIIAVKDEASTKLPQFFSEKLDASFGTHLSDLRFRQAYVAIFVDGKLKHEFFHDHKIVFNTEIQGKKIEIISSSREENMASIKINGGEFSPNQRGLNIVSMDGQNRYSKLYFDTYGIEYTK